MLKVGFPKEQQQRHLGTSEKRQTSRPSPRPTESETLGLGTSNLCLKVP